jgi:endonuclease YncB( thermonuclease family)
MQAREGKRLPVWLVAGAMLVWSAASWADYISGKVVGVADGDTITVLDSSNTQHKIRLAGIDAPEKAQPFGQVSKRNLSDMVFGQQVTIDWQKRDRYQRIVGKVLLNRRDVNLEQLKAGLAWHYKKYVQEQPVEDRGSYAQTELQAQQAKVGLWADVSPVAPWDWRKQKRTGKRG